MKSLKPSFDKRNELKQTEDVFPQNKVKKMINYKLKNY